jgi:hypothetical protein
VSSVFSLHALAAQKMPQLQNHLRRHAAEKPVIHARRSKTNPSNSQTADFVTLAAAAPMTALSQILLFSYSFAPLLCVERRYLPSAIYKLVLAQSMINEFVFSASHSLV